MIDLIGRQKDFSDRLDNYDAKLDKLIEQVEKLTKKRHWDHDNPTNCWKCLWNENVEEVN